MRGYESVFTLPITALRLKHCTARVGNLHTCRTRNLEAVEGRSMERRRKAQRLRSGSRKGIPMPFSFY